MNENTNKENCTPPMDKVREGFEQQYDTGETQRYSSTFENCEDLKKSMTISTEPPLDGDSLYILIREGEHGGLEHVSIGNPIEKVEALENAFVSAALDVARGILCFMNEEMLLEAMAEKLKSSLLDASRASRKEKEK